ncbi:CHAT domain-containing tetratricopeptide repeat protein [Nonomuraea sp. NPDC003804]|uniref:CHAT domain-containing protein n=1 Tax=Nonomuraea sp. NPDC003804 TaxID=3154547 RepID=UPI0033ACBFA2
MTNRLVAMAEDAVLQSGIDPVRALASARAIHAAASGMGAVEPAVVALRAMALASRELGDLEAAELHLRQAIATGDAPADRLAQARLSLVTVRTQRGHPLQALRIAAMAWAYLSPLDRAKLDTQRAVALAHLGRYQEAVASCDRAVAVLAQAPGTVDDQRFLAGGLLNRGLVHAYQSRWRQATADIAACLRLSQSAGLAHLARLAAANLPFLAVRQGDVAAAFAHYRACEDTLFGFPERLATMRADFAGALLAAQLPGEARAMLSLAVPELEAAGAQAALAEARLLLAQVELLTGDARQALAVAARAAAELRAHGRESAAPLAAEVALRARIVLEPPSPGLLAELLECARELAATSCAAGAAALRLAAAELALALDDTGTATTQLALLDPRAAAHTTEPRRLPLMIDAPTLAMRRMTRLASPLQAEHLAGADDDPDEVPPLVRWHAAALLARINDDRTAAFSAVLRGLRDLGADAERFDDPSLRAHRVRAGARLASFGLSLAIERGGPEAVFGWAERWRSVCGGRPIAPALDSVTSALGEAALVEFLCHDGALLVLVVTAAGCELRRLGDVTSVAEAVIRLRYGLRRASLGDGAHASDDPRRDPVAVEAAALEGTLFGPIADLVAQRPLVVVPAGPLHTLPWSVLPVLRGRPVSVTPSAAAWLSARTRRTAPPDRTTPPDGSAPPDRSVPPGRAAPGLAAPLDAVLSPPATSRDRTALRDDAVSGAGSVLSRALAGDGAVLGGAVAGGGSVAGGGAVPSDGGVRPGGVVPISGASARGGEPLVVAAAGPGLEHAEEEVRRVVGAHRRAEQVPARADDVIAALGRADVLHLAAHGTFHSRSPLLSSIELEDRPLMAYDLLPLSMPPGLVVLSACDSGMARVPAEGAPLGLAGTFLAQGASCVVGGLIPVPDEEALALMTAFHDLLAAGTAPAVALAQAGSRTGVLGFTCFGAGELPVTALRDTRPTAPDPGP